MNVRTFASEDAEKLSRLIIQNLRQVLIHAYPHEAIEALVPFFTPDKIREWPEQQLVLVGTLGNDVVGVASLDQDRVRNVFVDVARHRSGMGRTLMAAIESHAREQHLQKLYLMAGIPAAGFYEKLGYTVVKRIERDLNGIPIPEVHMEKVF